MNERELVPGENITAEVAHLAQQSQQGQEPAPDAQSQDVQEKSESIEQIAQNKPETYQAKHFRTMREKAERAERERDEALRRLQELEAARQQSSAPAPTDDDLAFEADALVEGKHMSKVASKIKKLEQQLQQYQQQSVTAAAEIRLKAQFPDFDSVVSQDNLELLNISHPEIAQTIRNSNSDLYGKAVTAYTMIKKLGIVPEQNFDVEKRRIAENQAKPKAVGSVAPSSNSPLGHAAAFDGRITDEEKRLLYQQMLESKKRL